MHAEQPQPQPQPGTTFTLVDGVAVPTGVPYLADADTDQEDDDRAPSTASGWVAWRKTDPEPGEAPAWDTLSAEDRAAWVGSDPAVQEAMAQAWPIFNGWVSREWPGCHLKRTPGATGLSLLEHSLPWPREAGARAYRYPTLPDELAALLAANLTQHRQEALVRGRVFATSLTIVDRRVAYAAELRHLPVIPLGCGVVRDDVPDYEPYRQGFYRVCVRVPADWNHLGLVPRKREGSGALTWEWPSAPGETWETWLHESEMRLCARHGWPTHILERVLFAPPTTPGNDPAREWSERLLAALAAVERAPRRTPAVLARRAALRAMILHAVGDWGKYANHTRSIVATFDEIPAKDAGVLSRAVTQLRDGRYQVSEERRLSPFQRHWRRIEWAKALQARNRCHVTTMALARDRNEVAAIDGDGFYLRDIDPRAYPDGGKVGAYRVKAHRVFAAPVPLPTTLAGLRRLGEEH